MPQTLKLLHLGSVPAIVGTVLLLCATLLAAVGLVTFESVVALGARLFSADGIVEAHNRRALAAALAGLTLVIGLAGLASIALTVQRWRSRAAAAIGWDPLRRYGLDVPNPYWTLAVSAGVGAAGAGIWIVSLRIGGPLAAFYAKEGAFEIVSVVLEIGAVVACIVAVRRWVSRAPALRNVPRCLVALACALMVVAVEELNWGQTLLRFDTPPAWAEINYQRETSLHNLVPNRYLGDVQRVAAVLFGLGVLALVWRARAASASSLGALAPPASLLPLVAFLVAGAFLHAEVAELLGAAFFAFYAYRFYIAARSSARPRPERARAEVP